MDVSCELVPASIRQETHNTVYIVDWINRLLIK